ncbi:MAG: hypothetical protein PVJ21_22090 [Anaerolineales bacterium]|jgi:hypothetical protein
MGFLLTLHSLVRWLIVIVGIVALVKFVIGLVQKSDFDKMDRGLSSGFSGLMDLQVTLGLLYFLITGFGGMGFPPYRIEHAVTMLIAAGVAHTPSMFKKAANKYAVALGAVVVALLLVYTGVARLPGGWSR